MPRSRVLMFPVDPSLGRPTPRYRVLLVDDDRPERALLQARLEESCRFEVIGVADDGLGGSVAAATLKPDLVALDISPPRGDGIGTIRRIQALSPASKVVVVSGLVSEDLVHATVDIMGASSCLDKNIGADRLVDECLNALERPGEPYNTSQRAAIDRRVVCDQGSAPSAPAAVGGRGSSTGGHAGALSTPSL